MWNAYPAGNASLCAYILLLQVYRLAQRFDVPRCRDACIAALCAVQVEKISSADVVSLLDHLPDPTAQQQNQLQSLCTKALLHMFGDVNRTANSAELLASFKQLSASAVQLWAASDQLQVVASENDVLWALGAWVQAQPEGALSSEDKLKLSGLVRVKQLTHSSRLKALCFDWFGPKNKLLQLLTVLDKRHPQAYSASEELLVARCSIPQPWLAGPRVQLPEAESSIRRTLVCEVRKQQVKDAMKRLQAGQSTAVRIQDPTVRVVEGCRISMKLLLVRKQGKAVLGSKSMVDSEPPPYLKLDVSYRHQQSDDGRTRWAQFCLEELYPTFGSVTTNGLLSGSPQFSSVEAMATQGYLVDGVFTARIRVVDLD